MLTGRSDCWFQDPGLKVGKANHRRFSERSRTQVQNEARFRYPCLQLLLGLGLHAPSVLTLPTFTRCSYSPVNVCL